MMLILESLGANTFCHCTKEINLGSAKQATADAVLLLHHINTPVYTQIQVRIVVFSAMFE